jgi:U4/U6 small nuclear ribonucleoprotein PRP3
MAAHPLLLDSAPAPVPQSKKDRYKPMLPKFASIKANTRNQPSPSPAPTHTPTPLERPGSVSANPYASGVAAASSGDGTFEGAAPAVKERIGRGFRFNQKGKYVAMGNQLRQDAQLEELKQRIAESAKKAGLDSEFETLERNIRVSRCDDGFWCTFADFVFSARLHRQLSGGMYLSFRTRRTTTLERSLSLQGPI